MVGCVGPGGPYLTLHQVLGELGPFAVGLLLLGAAGGCTFVGGPMCRLAWFSGVGHLAVSTLADPAL